MRCIATATFTLISESDPASAPAPTVSLLISGCHDSELNIPDEGGLERSVESCYGDHMVSTADFVTLSSQHLLHLHLLGCLVLLLLSSTYCKLPQEEVSSTASVTAMEILWLLL